MHSIVEDWLAVSAKVVGPDYIVTSSVIESPLLCILSSIMVFIFFILATLLSVCDLL